MLYSPIVPEPVVEIPNRPVFRASEVCELAQIPAYVLKSWEKEFPGLGVAAKPGAARVYRRADVEQVLRIKQLLFNEGLTLSGARRKLEGDPPPEEEPLPELAPPPAENVRDKVARVKQELRSLLTLLSAPPAKGHAAADSATRPPAEEGETPAAKRDVVAGERQAEPEEQGVPEGKPAGEDLAAGQSHEVSAAAATPDEAKAASDEAGEPAAAKPVRRSRRPSRASRSAT